MKRHFASFARKYTQFVERQGLFIIVAVCVTVITLTAVWTKRSDVPGAAPTPPISEDISAAQLFQQSLGDVSTPSPAPSEAVPHWLAPLTSVSVLQPFDGERLQQSGVTGVWRVHDAIDLQADAGQLVTAMADGLCVSAQERGVEGALLVIDHGSGICVQYAGMARLCDIRPGDPVAAGQTLGFAGNGMLDETDLPSHLHLRVVRDGQPIDPMLLLRTAGQ